METVWSSPILDKAQRTGHGHPPQVQPSSCTTKQEGADCVGFLDSHENAAVKSSRKRMAHRQEYTYYFPSSHQLRKLNIMSPTLQMSKLRASTVTSSPWDHTAHQHREPSTSPETFMSIFKPFFARVWKIICFLWLVFQTFLSPLEQRFL